VSALLTAWQWLSGSRVAQWIAAGVAALGAFWLALYRAERRGEERRRARQIEEDRDAHQRADQAGADYRSDGGARQRLRDGGY